MDEIVVRLDELTHGEMEEIEQHAGLEAFEAFLSGRPSIRVRNVLEWIVRRKVEPGLTLEQVRSQRFVSAPRVRIETGEERPTDAAS